MTRQRRPDGYYDRSGNLIGEGSSDETVLRWATLGRDAEYRRVAEDTVDSPEGEITVRTLWHGWIDHFTDPCCLQMFGTAYVISAPGGRWVLPVDVYDTEADALEGHRMHLDALRAGQHCRRCVQGIPHPEQNPDPYQEPVPLHPMERA